MSVRAVSLVFSGGVALFGKAGGYLARKDLWQQERESENRRERDRYGERERKRERGSELGALCAGSVSFLVLCESCFFFSYDLLFLGLCMR